MTIPARHVHLAAYRDGGSAGRAEGEAKWKAAWDRNKGDLERLIKYWSEGAGVAKIGWGVPCDFCRCYRHLLKYIHDPHETKGFCARLHKHAIGM